MKTKSEPFSDMALVAERQKAGLDEGSRGCRNFAGESDVFLARILFLCWLMYAFLPPTHEAIVCFCFEDIFNYTVPAKGKHNGILTSLLFSLWTAFQEHLHSRYRKRA